MNNKKLEEKLKNKNKIIPESRTRANLSLDTKMWEDIKELCEVMNKPYNVAVESLMALLYDDQFLEKFLEEIERR